MALDNEEIALATSSLFQTILDNFEGKDSKEHHGKDEALVLGMYLSFEILKMHVTEVDLTKGNYSS